MREVLVDPKLKKGAGGTRCKRVCEMRERSYQVNFLLRVLEDF